MTETAVEKDGDSVRQRLQGRAALKLHLTLILGLLIATGAFLFEVFRALGGNELSWAYVFEWPIFAAYGVYLWWNILHGYDRRPKVVRAKQGEGMTEEDLVQFAKWNAYRQDLQDREAEREGSEG